MASVKNRYPVAIIWKRIAISVMSIAPQSGDVSDDSFGQSLRATIDALSMSWNDPGYESVISHTSTVDSFSV